MCIFEDLKTFENVFKLLIVCIYVFCLQRVLLLRCLFQSTATFLGMLLAPTVVRLEAEAINFFWDSVSFCTCKIKKQSLVKVF